MELAYHLRRGHSREFNFLVKANREALMDFEDASPFSLLTALCHLKKIEFGGEQWNRIGIKVMGRFRKFALIAELPMKTNEGKRICALFLNAQTLEDIIFAFTEISTQLRGDTGVDTEPFFPLRNPLEQRKAPPPADPEELNMISRKFEGALVKIFEELISQFGKEKLQDESEKVAKFARWHVIGTITQMIHQSIAALGDTQEVAKATLGALGLHLPQLGWIPSQQLQQLVITENSNSEGKQEKTKIEDNKN